MIPDLEIPLLRTFVAVHDTGSITLAGKQVGRTQPAITHQMHRLERALGRPLFDGERRHGALTRDGEVLLAYARKLLSLNDEIRDRFGGPDIAGRDRLGEPDLARVIREQVRHRGAFHVIGALSTVGWDRALSPPRQEEFAVVLVEQEAGGGWSQFGRTPPDAYATGLSLYALHVAGVPATDETYKKGVGFLLGSQYQDGTWLVKTHSFPVQRYFESGFPYGRHQWISTSGTSWASLAIAQTLPDVGAAKPTLPR